jgi:hypothetical protein
VGPEWDTLGDCRIWLLLWELLMNHVQVSAGRNRTKRRINVKFLSSSRNPIHEIKESPPSFTVKLKKRASTPQP